MALKSLWNLSKTPLNLSWSSPESLSASWIHRWNVFEIALNLFASLLNFSWKPLNRLKPMEKLWTVLQLFSNHKKMHLNLAWMNVSPLKLPVTTLTTAFNAMKGLYTPLKLQLQPLNPWSPLKSREALWNPPWNASTIGSKLTWKPVKPLKLLWNPLKSLETYWNVLKRIWNFRRFL